MSRHNVSSMLKRFGLVLAVAGATLFQIGGCTVTDLLAPLTGLVPGLGM